MFTARRAAVRAFNAALSNRAWSAIGVRDEDRAYLLEQRREGIRNALAIVEAAKAERRMHYSDPDDARLDLMAAELRAALT